MWNLSSQLPARTISHGFTTDCCRVVAITVVKFLTNMRKVCIQENSGYYIWNLDHDLSQACPVLTQYMKGIFRIMPVPRSGLDSQIHKYIQGVRLTLEEHTAKAWQCLLLEISKSKFQLLFQGEFWLWIFETSVDACLALHCLNTNVLQHTWLILYLKCILEVYSHLLVREDKFLVQIFFQWFSAARQGSRAPCHSLICALAWCACSVLPNLPLP